MPLAARKFAVSGLIRNSMPIKYFRLQKIPAALLPQALEYTNINNAHALPPLVRRSTYSSGPRRLPGHLRRAVRRTRLRRHYAPPPDRTLFLDFRAARLSAGVSRVRCPRPRRKTLRLVWYRPAAAPVALRHRRNLDLAPPHIFQLRRHRPNRARYFRHLHDEHFNFAAYRVNLFSFPAPVGVHLPGVHRWRSRLNFLHYTPPLLAEHDGKQLHHAARAHRILLSIRMAAGREPPRLAHRLRRLRPEPAYPPHHRPGHLHWRRLSAPGHVLRTRQFAKHLGTLPRLRESCVPRLRIVLPLRPSIPVLPLRKFLQHLRSLLHHRTPPARSNLAREVSVGNALPRRIPRPPHHTRKIHLPLRSSHHPRHCSLNMALEAPAPRGKSLHRRIFPPAPRLHLPLRPLHLLERRLRLGRPIRFHRRRNGSVHFRSSTAPLSQRTRQICLDGRPRPHRHQRRYSNRVAGVLAVARNLSARNARPSYVRHLSALQKHHRLRTRKNERMGTKQSGDGPGPLGLRPHHYLEFSAVCFAKSRRSAGVGGANRICRLGLCACGTYRSGVALVKPVATARNAGLAMVYRGLLIPIRTSSKLGKYFDGSLHFLEPA